MHSSRSLGTNCLKAGSPPGNSAFSTQNLHISFSFPLPIQILNEVFKRHIFTLKGKLSICPWTSPLLSLWDTCMYCFSTLPFPPHSLHSSPSFLSLPWDTGCILHPSPLFETYKWAKQNKLPIRHGLTNSILWECCSMKRVENNYLIRVINYNEKSIIKKLAIILFKEKSVSYLCSRNWLLSFQLIQNKIWFQTVMC